MDEDNVFRYDSNEEIGEVIESGTGVIFIGDSKDNLSRVVVNMLLRVVSNTDLNIIHYSSDISSVSNYIDEEVTVPIVLFVVDGEVDSYHIGTIDNKEELTEDEEVSLYNIYLDGVHRVLNDVCDERC